MNTSEFQTHTEKLDRVLQQVASIGDENDRSAGLELMQALMDLHGAAMSRLVEILSSSGEASREALSRVADDPLIGGLLVLYGIHPVSLDERLARAIEKVRPQLQRQGAAFELLGCVEGIVRINVETPGRGHDSEATFRGILERAIREAAPEVVDIVLEGMSRSGFVPLNMIQPAINEEKHYEESAA